MQAPPAQYMSADVALDRIPGVVVRQEMQVGEAILQSLGIPWESKNKYKVAILPDGRHAIKVHDEPGRWQPTNDELKALPQAMRVVEESSAFTRILLTCLGCANLRPLKLHYYLNDNSEKFVAERPFKLGAACCCPLETTLKEGGSGKVIGKAVEDCSCCGSRCIDACCKCTFYTRVLDEASGAPQHRYTLRSGLACCGRVNNCFGASCCKPDLIIDVLDANGKLAATIQKTYAGGNGCGAFCRMVFQADSFIVEFPPDATAADRALLLNALFHIEYQLFEKSGDENNN